SQKYCVCIKRFSPGSMISVTIELINLSGSIESPLDCAQNNAACHQVVKRQFQHCQRQRQILATRRAQLASQNDISRRMSGMKKPDVWNNRGFNLEPPLGLERLELSVA